MKIVPLENQLPQRYNKPQKPRRLPKGELRKIYEEKFSNKYFPAFRVITDNRTMQFCPRDGAPLFLAKATYKSVPIGEAKCCPHCSTAFIQPEQLINDFCTGSKTLWVCKSYSQTCTHLKHKVISVTGILCRRRDFSTVEINVHYCTGCKEYFITKQQYDNYKTKYKDLMGNLKFVDSLDKIGSQTKFLANQESPLHMNGYSVRQDSGLTETDRRKILGFVIDNNILTKSEVIYYLSMFIDMAEKRQSANMEMAISKWKSDLDWVNYYKFEGQFKVKMTPPIVKPPKYTKP